MLKFNSIKNQRQYFRENKAYQLFLNERKVDFCTKMHDIYQKLCNVNEEVSLKKI